MPRVGRVVERVSLKLGGTRLSAIASDNVHVNDFAFGFHNVTDGMVILEERVFNILPIHQVRDLAVPKITFPLLKHVLEEGIRLKKASVIAEALSYVVSLAHVHHLQLLVY
jgi:hypothetical protein